MPIDRMAASGHAGSGWKTARKNYICACGCDTKIPKGTRHYQFYIPQVEDDGTPPHPGRYVDESHLGSTQFKGI
jgi:hypothetical protein